MMQTQILEQSELVISYLPTVETECGPLCSDSPSLPPSATVAIMPWPGLQARAEVRQEVRDLQLKLRELIHGHHVLLGRIARPAHHRIVVDVPADRHNDQAPLVPDQQITSTCPSLWLQYGTKHHPTRPELNSPNMKDVRRNSNRRPYET